MREPRRSAGRAAALAVLWLTAGCAGTRAPAPPASRAPAKTLVAGVVADVPPYGWVQESTPTGMEVDFAGRLGSALGRPVRVLAMPFDELFAALEAGRVDIVMGGLTVTRARQARMAFSQPYLRGGLLAAMRRQERDRYATPASALAAEAIGVVTGTTGAAWVEGQVDSYRVKDYRRPRDAMNELRQRRVDVVVHDAPVMVWFVSGHDDLAVLPKLLTREDLAWAMRYDEAELRQAVDATLARWRSDGTLDAVIARWLPYWSQVRAE